MLRDCHKRRCAEATYVPTGRQAKCRPLGVSTSPDQAFVEDTTHRRDVAAIRSAGES